MTSLLSNLLPSLKTLINHLWLSVSSVKFYENVFRNYTGYGIKYILNLSFIASFFCSALLLNEVSKLKNYLDHNIISTNLVNIDHIINHMPSIEYDGQKITTQDSEAFFLYNIDNKKIVAIDPNNNLTPSDRIKIPLILNSNQFIINTIDATKDMHKTIFTETIKYQQIFGTHAQTITQETIRAKLSIIADAASTIIIILIFPILIIAIFLITLMDQGVVIIIAYAITLISKTKISFKPCIRVVLFSSGLHTLFRMLLALMAVFNFPDFSMLLVIIQILANLLMIIGIWKASTNPSVKTF